MNARQGRLAQSLTNGRAFLDLNAERLPELAASGIRQQLDAALAGLSASAEAQGGYRLVSMGETQRLRRLRRELVRDHMAPVAGVAAAGLPRTPELAALRLPQRQLSDQDLVLAAKAMATAAEPFTGLFIAAGASADFIARLTAAADALAASRDSRAQSHARSVGATTGVADQLRVGRVAIMALNKFVTSALQEDPAMLANWKAVIRVRNAPSAQAVPAVVTPVAPPALVKAAA